MKTRKLAVVTICIGDFFQKLAKLTHPSIKAYAERIGADFIILNESQKAMSHPDWEKFQIFDLLSKYRRIAYLDTDLIVREDCPDLFKMVPEDHIGAFNEAPFTLGRVESLREVMRQYGMQPQITNKYFNMGVFVISENNQYLLVRPEKEFNSFFAQGYLNALLLRYGAKMFELPYTMNRMCCMDQLTGEDRHASHIIHYAGQEQESIQNLVIKDLRTWRVGSPKHQYKSHILIDVQGGMGDQVCAEPAIRYLKEHLAPNDEIILKTHFPRLFEHLNLPVYDHDKVPFEPDICYYYVYSTPGPDRPLWNFLPHVFCHPVDYCAIAITKRILPNADKQIKLKVKKEEIQQVQRLANRKDLKNLIVVHPGRHWPSKTFPTKWWEYLILELSQHNKVCIIGKDIDDEVGYVPVNVANKNIINLRDRLNLGQLIALISKAKMLISNDSGPVHLAGAFDNQIVVIATCKHPDHTVPFREGGMTHKVKAFYKGPVIDLTKTKPNMIAGKSIDIPEKNIINYIPEISAILNYVKQVK